MTASAFIRDLRKKIGNDLLQVPTVSVLVFDNANRVLLVRQIDNGLWTTVGGMIEPGETPADAAVREAWQETGLEVELARIVGAFGGERCDITYSNGDHISWVSTVFEATVTGGRLRPDNRETNDVRYFSRQEIKDVPCTPHVADFLAVAWSGVDTAYFRPPVWRPPNGA